ncbi:MAG: hypothetical protein Q4D23_00495 [Bacteroidales bacterium]|nr:hypothetical protein [Bacteroidales bacterium]
MGLFDIFKKKKKDEVKPASGVIDTMSQADAITEAASKAAEAKAEEEMDELTRIALEAGGHDGQEEKSEKDMTPEELIAKAHVAIQSDDNATAIRCFKAAMNMGSMEGKVHVARCYETGRGVSKDEPHAFKLYRDAALAGYNPVLSNLGNCYINGIGTPADPAEGFNCFKKGAEAGDPICMANVATCLMQGVGVEKNPEEGLEWFAKASEAGNTEAEFQLGMIYLQVPDYREKANEGLERVRKAAEAGVLDAIMVMAQIHDEGGPAHNMEECIKWLTIGAERGHKHAQCRLGQIYVHGRGVERDMQKGYNYLVFSAQQNYTPAIYLLAELNLLYTNNNPQALQQGMAQLSQCVKESYPPAFMLMGQCCLEGRAVPKDQAQAVKFFTLAANNGVDNAAILLAKLYSGDIEQVEFDTDPEQAKHWYEVACENGHPVALTDFAVSILKNKEATEEDKAKAADYLRRAAQMGYTAALQVMTENGISFA